MPYSFSNSSRHFFNKKQTLVQVGTERLLLHSQKAIWVSLVFQQRTSVFLPGSYLSTKQLACFGVAVSTAALGRVSYIGYTSFFTLGELCQPRGSLRQFILFLDFMLKFKTTLTRPVGICVNSLMFSVAEGLL